MMTWLDFICFIVYIDLFKKHFLRIGEEKNVIVTGLLIMKLSSTDFFYRSLINGLFQHDNKVSASRNVLVILLMF